MFCVCVYVCLKGPVLSFEYIVCSDIHRAKYYGGNENFVKMTTLKK